MTIFTQRLLRVSALLPDESLISLLTRLAKLNYYDSLNTLTSLLNNKIDREDFTKDSSDLPTRALTYEHLAALTGLSPSDLYTATGHCFAHVLNAPGSLFKPIHLPDDTTRLSLARSVVNRQLRPRTSVQFCPNCLEEGSYHRRTWLPVAVAMCLRHQCLLVTGCQMCGKMLNIKSITEATCDQCKSDLTKTKTIEIDNGFGMMTQEIIQSWLFKGTTPTNSLGMVEEPLETVYRL